MPLAGIGSAAEVDPVASLVTALNTATSSLTAATLATAASLQKSSNLSDLTSASSARTNLGLGSLAVLSAIDGGTP